MKYTTFNDRPFEVHRLMLDQIADGSRVLELGCATGYFSERLKRKRCYVVGVEYEKEAAKIASKICDKVLLSNLEDLKKVNLRNETFDVVLAMDIIEHLRNYAEIVTAVGKWLRPEGRFFLSTPNIAHVSIRLGLLMGKFEYTYQGILDETHVHFFTRESLIRLLKEKRFSIISIQGSTDLGQVPILGRYLRHIPKSLQAFIVQLFPRLLAVQWVVEARVE